MTILEIVLNSTVIGTTITVVGGFVLTYLTYAFSRKNDKVGIFKRRKKDDNAKRRTEDQMTYAGYEKVIKELSETIDRQNIIINRMTDVDKDRDKLIDALRKKEEALYAIIEEKNLIIAKLTAENNKIK